ncbi:SIR2-domain-containing protein [Hesseltinella vesiculosa]|uniref:SIR2-domain-containing protein n=1 Tax=Hesseltinella vesiculosa TaxID=101127 RepID=A0A1X2GWN3_9FUNG|nr:SIR2-domain-containing protein [Hesseltinella vesiculosa]
MPHPYFEDEYNEESDGDWAEEESDHDSESDIGSDEELIHAALSLDKNRKHSDSDQQPDQEDQIEEIILPWESFTEEEKEDIRQDARKIGFMKFFDKYAIERREPIARLLEAFGLDLPPHVIVATQAIELAKVLRSIVTRYLRKRDRLDNVNTLQDVVQLIRDAKKIMIVTGAGVSVSCGIPDFRSESGIYSRLQEYELDDPQQMFDIDYFREMPEIFYSFAREVYPGKYEPSPSHVFVKLVEDKGKLLRNYTQNIDTLEHKVGINNLVNCHGSFATASCVTCDYKCQGKDIEDAIYQQMVPPCPKCASAPSPVKPASNVSDDEDAYDPPRGVSIMKPDITFFGEKLPDEFDRLLAIDTEQVDLLIVMGSSLKVAPVSDIMTHIPHSVPQILINRTPITHMTFDVQLLGNSDDIVPELCRMLDWDLKHTKLPGGSALSDESKALSRIPNDIVLPLANQPPPSDHMWTFVQNGLYVFPGAVFDPKLLK